MKSNTETGVGGRSGGLTLLRKLSPYMTLLVAVAALLPYLAGLDGKFVFDDIESIREDPFYRLETNPLKCWTRSYWPDAQTQGMYRPLTLFTYWLNARMFAKLAPAGSHGLYSPGFRLVNLILHVLISILVFQLAQRLRFGRSASFAGALLYAVHPIHVEAVTPAFGRGELLCAFFLLSALLLHLKSGESPRNRVLAAFCFALSFMSKEHGVVFLPIAVLIDIYLTMPRPRLPDLKTAMGLATRYLPYVVAVAAVFSLRRYFLGSWLPAQQFFDRSIDNVIALSPPAIRIVSAVKIQGLALWQFLWPAVLSHDYSFARLTPVSSVFDPGAWGVGAAILGTPALLAVYQPKLRRKIILLTMLFVVSVLPAGNFIVPAGTIYAERLQYLPSIWLAILAGALFSRFSRPLSLNTAVAIGIAAILALSARTFVRTLDWRNSRSLAESGVIAAPESLKVWNNYAVVLGADGNFRGAIDACDKALSIRDDYATGHANKGLFLAKAGRLKEAEAELKRALKLSRWHPAAAYNLGVLYMNTGRSSLAAKLWKRALMRNPTDKRLKKAVAALDTHAE